MILSRSYISSSSLPAAHSMMVIVLIQLVSPIVLTIRPPACTWDNWCDQKLMIDLEWWICKAMQYSHGNYLQKLFPKKILHAFLNIEKTLMAWCGPRNLSQYWKTAFWLQWNKSGKCWEWCCAASVWMHPTKNEMQLQPRTLHNLWQVVKDYNTIDHNIINAIMCEASIINNSLCHANTQPYSVST